MKDLRERAERLLEQQRRWCDRNNCDDSSALAQQCLAESIEAHFREVHNETLEDAAKLVEHRADRLSSDPHYGGGIENAVRGILLCKADDIREMQSTDTETLAAGVLEDK